jgi:hypothetical protein
VRCFGVTEGFGIPKYPPPFEEQPSMKGREGKRNPRKKKNKEVGVGEAYLPRFLDFLSRFRLFFSTRAAVSVLDVFVDDAAFGVIFLSAT